MAKIKDFIKSQASQFVDTGVNKLLGNIFGGGDSGPKDGFKVGDFAANLDKSGIARTNHFEVFVLGAKSVGDEREMRYRAESADIPGRNLTVADHKFNNIGPFNRIPTGQTYPDITVSFILSEDLREKDYFESWQESIMNTGAYEGGSNPTSAMFQPFRVGSKIVNEQIQATSLSDSYTNSPFGFKYFDDYIGRLEIRQYGAAGDLRSIHTLNEAYPISIAPVSMSWADDNAARLAVTFSYRNYKVVFNKQDQPGMGTGFSFSLGKGGLKFGANIPGLGNISYAKGAGVTGNVAKSLTKRIFG